MKIGNADSSAIQASKLNQSEQLIRLNERRLRQQGQVAQNLLPVGDGTQRQFQPHQGMGCDFVVLEQILEFCLGASEVIDPDGSVNENHVDFLCAGARLSREDRSLQERPDAGRPRSEPGG